MTRDELFERFDKLEQILFLSRGLGYFSSGQRTCIHMERAAILRALGHIDNGAETAKPSYTIPEHLEVICKQVLTDFQK